MFNFVEKILIAIFSILPDASTDDSVILAVNNSIALLKPTFYNLNLIFPITTLFKIFMLVIFIEVSLFLIGLVMKVAVFFRG